MHGRTTLSMLNTINELTWALLGERRELEAWAPAIPLERGLKGKYHYTHFSGHKLFLNYPAHPHPCLAQSLGKQGYISCPFFHIQHTLSFFPVSKQQNRRLLRLPEGNESPLTKKQPFKQPGSLFESATVWERGVFNGPLALFFLP